MRLLIVVFMLVLGDVVSESATSIEFRKVGSGGTREWNGGANFPCFHTGTTCKVTIVRPEGPTGGSVSPYGTGYIVEGLIQNIRHTLASDTTTWKEFSGANAQLDSTLVMRVISSDEYPALNGREVNLHGISADANGKVSVYFP